MAKPNSKPLPGATPPTIRSKLHHGVRLNVIYENERDGGEAVYLVSSFEVMEDDKVLLITAPAQGEVLFPLHEGDKININFTMDNIALFSFDALVRARIRQDNVYFLRVEACSELHRTNRRQDFRMQVAMQGVIEKFDVVANKAKGYVVYITDLSGGGAAIQTDLNFELGDKTNLYIPMEDGAKCFPSEVRRCIRIQNPDALYHYNVGLRFLFANEREKDAMVSYIFRLQRQMKKRM